MVAKNRDPLFSERRTPAEEFGSEPVLVVGMPRSGSSFLSHVLSQFSDYYIFDDLYLMAKAKSIGAQNPLNESDLDKLLFFLGWQIRARLKFGKYAIPNIEENEVEAMDAALKQAFMDKPGSALDLQREWLHRLAIRGNARQWGFKMPRAFIEVDKLREEYPNLKVIFLMREPHSVLASYKHMPKSSQDGDPRRYHPIYYAAYWMIAARHAKRLLKDSPDSTLFIKFGDLVKNTKDVSDHIAIFLNQPVLTNIDKPKKPNSSHGSKSSRSGITGLETAIVSVFCSRLCKELGFGQNHTPIKMGDFSDFLGVSWRFLKYQLSRLKQNEG